MANLTEPISSNLTQLGNLQPVFEPVKNLVGTLELFVGGIFGLYLIFALIQYYYAHRKNKLLMEILEEIRGIRGKLGKIDSKSRKR